MKDVGHYDQAAQASLYCVSVYTDVLYLYCNSPSPMLSSLFDFFLVPMVSWCHIWMIFGALGRGVVRFVM